MDVTLDVPFADTSAAHLGWSLGQEPLPALASRRIPLGSGRLELRLLGASHQVLLDSTAGSLSEVVSYQEGDEAHLPGRAHRRMSGLAYSFRSRVKHFSTDAWYVSSVRRLVRRTSAAEFGLVGHFPGAETAVTALVAVPAVRPVENGEEGAVVGTVSWRTWHAYPQTREIAWTRTRVRVR